MTLFLILALMTAAAIFAVLWPLSRRPSVPVGGQVDGGLSRPARRGGARPQAGLFCDTEAEAARLRNITAIAWRGRSGRLVLLGSRGRLVAAPPRRLVALIAQPVPAGLYIHWGSPNLPGAPLAARLDLPAEQRSIESMVAQVEAHLERNP